MRHAFGAHRVLDGIDLIAAAGTVLCLLGPNGAGKTTAVRIMSTLTVPDAGSVHIAGFDAVRDPHEVRRRIGLTGQHTALDETLTGTEQLELLARLHGAGRRDARRRAIELLERFGLDDAGGRRIGTYSGGMRRRLDLAASSIVRPVVLFLDEPTTGLDLRSRLALWDVVRDLTADGTTVVLTTQYLEEADALSDRIVVIDGGRVVAEGTSAELRSRVGDDRLVLEAVSTDAFDELVRAAGDRAIERDRDARRVVCSTDGTAADVRALIDRFDPDRDLVARLDVRAATLDDVFLATTGIARVHSAEVVDV